jgi:hypothetical protein
LSTPKSIFLTLSIDNAWFMPSRLPSLDYCLSRGYSCNIGILLLITKSSMNLKIADFFIGTFSGGTVAWVVYQTLPSDTHMLLAMILGGLIGMTIVLPLKFLLMPLFGGFEVVIPLGIIGMGVGMTAGMLSTLPDVSGFIVIVWGNLAGIVVATLIYFSNKHYINS